MTHFEDRTEHHTPVPEGASAKVDTTDQIRVTTPGSICGMGHRMKRKEDPRFLQGKGRYVDDVKLPGMLHMDIVRSPYAHAKILSIDDSEALAMDGVVAVIKGEDLKAAGNLHWMPTLMSDTQMVLPIEKVAYYAQEVCVVLATDRYVAADAVEKIYVDYEPLPAVVDPHEALNGQGFCRGGGDGRAEHAHSAHPRLLDRDLWHGSELQQGHRPHADLHDLAGAARPPHGLRAGERTAGAEDPDHLAGHRRRFRRQGTGLPGVRVLRGGQPGYG
jgi:hypothetical protein